MVEAHTFKAVKNVLMLLGACAIMYHESVLTVLYLFFVVKIPILHIMVLYVFFFHFAHISLVNFHLMDMYPVISHTAACTSFVCSHHRHVQYYIFSRTRIILYMFSQTYT